MFFRLIVYLIFFAALWIEPYQAKPYEQTIVPPAFRSSVEQAPAAAQQKGDFTIVYACRVPTWDDTNIWQIFVGWSRLNYAYVSLTLEYSDDDIFDVNTNPNPHPDPHAGVPYDPVPNGYRNITAAHDDEFYLTLQKERLADSFEIHFYDADANEVDSTVYFKYNTADFKPCFGMTVN